MKGKPAMNLTLTRVVALLAALGAGITAFTGAVTTSGDWKAAAIAGFSAVVLTWIHEEHSTARNADTAAATVGAARAAAQPAAPPPELAELTTHLAGMLGGPGATPGAAVPPPPGATPHSAQPAPGT